MRCSPTNKYESAYGQQNDQGKFADLVPVILSSRFL